MYTSSIYFVKRSLAVAVSAALLTACGGGGGGGDAAGGSSSRVSMSGSVSGTVADGYIMGATAFLDIDGDKQRDEWEPSSTTDILTDPTDANAGSFSVDLTQWVQGLTDSQYSTMVNAIKASGLDTSNGLTAADLLAAFSIVVEIPEDAIDTDKPTETVGSSIKLSSPPVPKGEGASENAQAFISPITTVLDQKVSAKKKELKEKERLGLAVSEEEKDVSALLATAKKEVKQDLGLTEGDSDEILTGDYIKAKTGTDANLAHKLHTVAKITTTLLAKGVQDTAGNSGSESQMDAATKQAIIDAVTEKVLSQMNIIAQVSNKIVIDSTSGGTVNVDIAAIDTQKISEQAQAVAVDDPSLNAAELTEVSVDQDEIAAAKQATTSSTESPVTNTEIAAFLQSNPAQILPTANDAELRFRLLNGDHKKATWGSDTSFSDEQNTSKLWNGTGWLDVSVTQEFSGVTETLTFTPADTNEETVSLIRNFSGSLMDLSGKAMRITINSPRWKDKITAGTVFAAGSPKLAKLVAQRESELPVTLQLSTDLSYQGLTVSIDSATGEVSLTGNGSTLTSVITPSVTAVDGAFTLPADIAARFNIPEDQRDWIVLSDASLGYQLGKSPVIYDWFNAEAFDQIRAEAINTDGLVASKNLVARLDSDTVTVDAAPLLIPEGWSLTSVIAEEPAIYGRGTPIQVNNTNTFSLTPDSTAKVTLTYSKSGADDLVQTGYVHRGKATAGEPVAGRDYKITSQVQWNGSSYEHGLKIWLRESLFSTLKSSTLDGSNVVTSNAAYEVQGNYRVYDAVAAKDTIPQFGFDGAGSGVALDVVGLPAVPTENPANLAAASVTNALFDGRVIRFRSLSSTDAANATEVCFELTLSKGADSTTRKHCLTELSDTGEYQISLDSLDIPAGYFDSVSVTGLSLNETISSIEVAQAQTLSGADVFGLPQKGSLTERALAGETLYLTHFDQENEALVYLQVSYSTESGWQVLQLSSDGWSRIATDLAIDGNALNFMLNNESAVLSLTQLDGVFQSTAGLTIGGQTSDLELHDTISFGEYLDTIGMNRGIALSWDGTNLSFAGVPKDSQTLVIHLAKTHENILIGSDEAEANLYTLSSDTSSVNLASLVQSGGIATPQSVGIDLLTELTDGGYKLFVFSTSAAKSQVDSYISGYGPLNDSFLEYFGDVALADFEINVNYTPSQLAQWIMSEELYADFSYNLDNKHYQLGLGNDGPGLDSILSGQALEIRHWNSTTAAESVLQACSDSEGCHIALNDGSYSAGDELRVYLDGALQESVVLQSMSGITEADVVGVDSAVFDWKSEISTVVVRPVMYGLASNYSVSADVEVAYQDDSSEVMYRDRFDDGFAWNGTELAINIFDDDATSPISEVNVSHFSIRSMYNGIPLVSSVVPLPDLSGTDGGGYDKPALLDVAISGEADNNPLLTLQGIPASAKTIGIYVGQQAGGILIDKDDVASSILLIDVAEASGGLDLNALLAVEANRATFTKTEPDLTVMQDAAYEVHVFASDLTPSQAASVLAGYGEPDSGIMSAMAVSAEIDEDRFVAVGSYVPTLLEQWDEAGMVWAAVRYNLDKEAYEFSVSWNDPDPESLPFQGKVLRLAMDDGTLEQDIISFPNEYDSKYGNVGLNLSMGSTLKVYLDDVLQETVELDSGISSTVLAKVTGVVTNWDGNSINITPSFSNALPADYELDMELELTDAAGNVRHLYLGDHYPGVSWDGSVLSYTPNYDDFVISDAKLSFFELRITENEVPAVSGVYNYDDGKTSPDGSDYGLKAVFTDLTTTVPKITVSDIPVGTQSILIGIDEKEPNFLSDYDDFRFIEMWAVPTDGATSITVNLADVVNNGVPMKELSTLATPVDLESIADSTFFVAGVAFTHSASDVMAAINSWGDRIDTDYFDEENGTVTGYINQSYIETGSTTGTVSESANAFADEDNSGTSFDFSYSVSDGQFRFSASSPWFGTESSLTLKVDDSPLTLDAIYMDHMSSYQFGLPNTITNADLLGKTLSLEFNNGSTVEHLGELVVPSSLPTFGIESIALTIEGDEAVFTPTFSTGTDLSQFVSMEIDAAVDISDASGQQLGYRSLSTWDETIWDGTSWRLTKAQLLEADEGTISEASVDWSQTNVSAYYIGVVSNGGLKMSYSYSPEYTPVP